MQIKEIMTKKVIFVDLETKIIEVAGLLTRYKFHGLPVVENEKVKGIITETDFFLKEIPNLYLPVYVEFFKKKNDVKDISREEIKKIDNLLKAKAKDIMSVRCVTVKEDGDINELIKFFKIKHFFTFPVVNELEKIVGIITQADIIKMIKGIED